jgi:hypothetical protein
MRKYIMVGSGIHLALAVCRRSRMPRFFIDTDDGVFKCCDEDGAIYGNVDEAKALALKCLPEMLIGRDFGGDQHVITAVVRDEIGEVITKATLHLAIEVRTKPRALDVAPFSRA